MKFFIFISAISLGGAVLQEIILRESEADDEGNFYTFREGIPDITIYPFHEKIVRFCQNSRLGMYSGVNYSKTMYQDVPEETCWSIRSFQVQSARFYGNRDTTEDGLSLYAEKYLVGKEIYVEQSPIAGITEKVSSLGYSGKSAWTVFEGTYFNGTSACLPPPEDINNTSVYYDITGDFNMTTIGSLFKGCVPNVTPEMRRQLLKAATIT